MKMKLFHKTKILVVNTLPITCFSVITVLLPFFFSFAFKPVLSIFFSDVFGFAAPRFTAGALALGCDLGGAVAPYIIAPVHGLTGRRF